MSLYPVSKFGKYGFIDKNGILPVIKPQYDAAHFFSEGLARVKNNTKYGYINDGGKLVIPCIYDDAHDFSEGLSAIKIDGKYGYINKAGEIIVKPNYEFADQFSCGLARVKHKGLYGFIDKLGNFIIKPEHHIAKNFTEDMALIGASAYYGWVYGFIDKSGKTVIKPQFEVAKEFSCGFALVSDGKWGYIDKKGKYAIKPAFTFAEPFFDNMAVVGVKGEFEWSYGYINIDGKVVIEPRFEYAYPFSEGLAAVKITDIPSSFGIDQFETHILKKLKSSYRDQLNKLYSGTHSGYTLNGNITSKDRNLIKELLDEAGIKLASSKYGYIDKTGREVISPRFDGAEPFRNGVARITIAKKNGYINTSGEIIWEPSI